MIATKSSIRPMLPILTSVFVAIVFVTRQTSG